MIYTSSEEFISTWLNRKKINYDFYSTLTKGRPELDGVQVPFVLPDKGLAIRILEENNAQQVVEKQFLRNIGLRVVDIYADDLARDVESVMSHAIEGKELRGVDSDLWFPNEGMYKGVPTFVGANLFGLGGYGGDSEPYDVVAAVVTTDAATGTETKYDYYDSAYDATYEASQISLYQTFTASATYSPSKIGIYMKALTGGTLRISIVDVTDTVTLSYGEMSDGWNYLEFSDVIPLVTGYKYEIFIRSSSASYPPEVYCQSGDPYTTGGFYDVQGDPAVPVEIEGYDSLFRIYGTSGYTLNGTLTYDGGGDCSVRFQYGLTTSYGNDTAWQTAKLTGDTFTYTPSGLTVGQTYHFRAQAKNKYRIASGSDRTFTYG